MRRSAIAPARTATRDRGIPVDPLPPARCRTIRAIAAAKRREHPELRMAPLTIDALSAVLEREAVIVVRDKPYWPEGSICQFMGTFIVIVDCELPEPRRVHVMAHEAAHLWLLGPRWDYWLRQKNDPRTRERTNARVEAEAEYLARLLVQ